jgi:transposase
MKNIIPPLTIGLDLGDKNHAVCVLDQDGDTIEQRFITNHKESLRRLSKKFPGARIAMETGTHSPWISRLLIDFGHEVIVANARKLRAIYLNDRKSDEADAQMIARLARVDPKLLSPIQHGSEKKQRDLIQIKLRDALVRQRVTLICGVRGTLKSLGIQTKSPSSACFTRRLIEKISLSESAILEILKPTIEVIDTLSEKIKFLDKQITKMADEQYPETIRLRQICGIGALTALSFVLIIGDPHRFKSSRSVGAYLGLTPKRDQSGDSDKQLRISKAGDSYLRKLLVSASQYALGPFGKECDLRTRGLILAERGGPRAKKKAVIATARKLTSIMHSMLLHQSDYQSQKVAA